ncbi:hypothetical protein SK128_027521, partial [Halocaridina rubra]
TSYKSKGGPRVAVCVARIHPLNKSVEETNQCRKATAKTATLPQPTPAPHNVQEPGRGFGFY